MNIGWNDGKLVGCRHDMGIPTPWLWDSHVLMHKDRDGDHLMTEQYNSNVLNDKIDINETTRLLYLMSKYWK